MTGLEAAAGGAVVKLIVERGVPKGFALARVVFQGKTIMLVGPARSGKTTFISYLQHGIFQDPQDIPRTYDPVDSSHFNLRLGPNKTLDVIVKTVVDLPGQ